MVQDNITQPPPPRRIIMQIAVGGDAASEAVIALASDGTLWALPVFRQITGSLAHQPPPVVPEPLVWRRLPDLPS